jgi:hypothetical protein
MNVKGWPRVNRLSMKVIVRWRSRSAAAEASDRNPQ